MTGSQTVRVTIFGTDFSFRTDDPEYMKELAAYVDGEIQKVADSGKVTSQAKAAILAAFTIADELLRLKKEHADFSKRLDSLLEMAEQVQPASPQAE